MTIALAIVQTTVLAVLALFTALTWSALIAQVRRGANVRYNRNGGPFVVVRYGTVERTFPFSNGHVSLGRNSRNDIVIKSPGVSQRHIVLDQRHGKFYVTNVDGQAFIAPDHHVDGEVRLDRTDQILLGSNDDDAVRISIHRS